jgi:hypothetical protein
MKPNDITKLANKLNFLGIQAYLASTGWKKVQGKRTDIGIFTKERDEELYEILLPLSKDFSDYTIQIIKAIKILAKYEGKFFEELLTDLNLSPFDTLRFRVHNSDTEEGTISFKEVFDLLNNAKKVLYAAACDILHPEPYHKRLSFKAADSFIEKCRLGQTEMGSFIASVVCPFVNDDIDERRTQYSLFSDSEDLISSFTRKVTTQVMKSIEAVKIAVDTNSIDSFINGDMGIKVSGNFLESLIELNELDGDGEINIMTSWSAMAPSNANVPTYLSLTKEYIPAIENIIEKVRPAIEDKPGEYVGKISGTQAEPDANKREKGDITFTFADDEKVIKAKVTLSLDQYNMACEAHKDGRNVKITGILISKGKSKIIDNAVFSII